jgi:hypothetical protein
VSSTASAFAAPAPTIAAGLIRSIPVDGPDVAGLLDGALSDAAID